MKLIQNQIYMNWKELVDFGFTNEYLKKATYTYRSTGSTSYANIQDPEDNRRNLIEYDSIPEKTRIEKQIPLREDLLRQLRENQLSDILKIDAKAFDIYYASPASAEANDLQEMAGWLMASAPMNRKQARALGYVSVDGFYTDVMNLTSRKDLKGSVTNLRIFKRKIKPFYQYLKSHPSHFDPTNENYYLTAPDIHPAYREALETLISKKYGKKNAARLKKKDESDQQAEEQQALLIRLYSDPIKLSIDQTWAAYMRQASQMMQLHQQTGGENGWDERCAITSQTVKNFLTSPNIRQIWYSKRHGKKPAADVFSVITKRKAASFANAKWVIDGTPMPLYFSHNGKNYNRIHVFVVLDEYSWAIVGYGISYSENADHVLAALRDACRRTNCLPHEIQSDNSSAIKSWHVQHAIKSIAKYYTPATAGNARSKRVENFFRHFNAQILKFKPGYLGGHSNSLEYQPNEEHLAKMVRGNQLPTLSEAFNIMEQSFHEWSGIIFHGDQPFRKYSQSLEKTKADQLRFTPEKDVDAFWYQPGKMVKIKEDGKTRSIFKPTEYQFSNRGISVQRTNPLTKEKEHFVFDIPDAAFTAQNITRKFTLKIEPENFSSARIYQDGKPVLDALSNPITAVSKIELPSAQADHTPETRLQLANELSRKKDQVKIAEEKFDRYMKIAAKNGHTQPIETSWVHGKLTSDTAIAELNEQRLSALHESNEDTEDEQLVYADQPPKETLSRF